MTDTQPNFLKFVSGKISLKYFLLAIFLIVILIATGVSLKILYFTHNASAVLNKPQSSTNESSNNQRSESLKQLIPSLTSTGPIKVVYNLPEKQPVVYITIDDGWYPNEEVLKLMQQYHLPITTFLIEQAAQEHPDFWHEFVRAGGHIEDHTFSHPFLTHLSLADEKNQISQPLDYFRQYGPLPDELRPPYGDFNSDVGQAARDSGIKYIVMWNAEMRDSTLYTRNNQELKPGDIILLHWVPGLEQEIVKLLNIIQKQNLGIADLTQVLNGEPLTISWLKAPIPTSTLVTGGSKPVINNSVPPSNTNQTAASSTTAAPSLKGTVDAGSTADTTKIIISDTVAAGDNFKVLVSNTAVTGYKSNQVPSGAKAYTCGSDITGVSPTNKYVGLYEVDANGNIVKFTAYTLTSANIKNPSAQSLVISGSGSVYTLKLTFDTLDATKLPVASAFVIKDTTSGKSIASSTVTVSSPGANVVNLAITGIVINSGDTVSVSYTKPALNPLQDINGNQVDTISATGALTAKLP